MRAIKLILISLSVIFLAGSSFKQDDLKLHFINVGEGEAILIQHKNNNVVIDTGNLLSGYKLTDYLVRRGVNTIKYLIISHPHPDHIAGVFFILGKFRVEQIYDNGQALNDNDDIEYWYKLLARSSQNYRRLKKSDRLKLQDLDLDVLWPNSAETGSYNENSLVIKLILNNFSCLFTGDLNSAAEEKLLKEKFNLKANILKVGHHGFKDATSKEFLGAVSPRVAIISTGLNNRLGSPSPIILDLLKERGIDIYRTDRDGDIIISVNTDGTYSIKTEEKKQE